ncbi:MAG: ribosome-associated translation inhibitor RaiA [Pseudomonadota bacterium]
MKMTITFRHMQSSPAIKEYVDDRLSKLDRYLRHPTDAHVILTVEKSHHFAEIVVSSKGLHAKGSGRTQDMYAAIDGAVEKVEKTLKRYHDKKIQKSHDTPLDVTP